VGYEIINPRGGKNPTSINEMIGKIEGYMGRKAKINYKPFHETDIKETWADISKAQKLINWHPKVNIEDGLVKTIGWYLENKGWLKNIKV
jgi:UDP-glucuronate 4-epimerase